SAGDPSTIGVGVAGGRVDSGWAAGRQPASRARSSKTISGRIVLVMFLSPDDRFYRVGRLPNRIQRRWQPPAAAQIRPEWPPPGTAADPLRLDSSLASSAPGGRPGAGC